MRGTLALSPVFEINAFLNNDQLSLEVKRKLKLNLLAGDPEDVTQCQEHWMFSPQKGYYLWLP